MQRGAEGDRVEVVGVVRRVGVGAGEVGVAEAVGHEAQGGLDELDLDAGPDAEPTRLSALGELPADRVVVGRLGVVEDEGA